MARTGGISYLHTTSASGSAVGGFTLSTGAVQAGDLVMLRVVVSAPGMIAAPVITDTSASTWTLLYSIQPQTPFQHFVYAATVATDGTYTISGTFSRSDVSYGAQADAFGNAALPVHGTGTASGSGPSLTAGIPASTAGDLLYVAVMSQGTFLITGMDTDWEPLSAPGTGSGSGFTVAAYKLSGFGGPVSWTGTSNDPAAGHLWWSVGFALTSAVPVVPPPPSTGTAGTGRPTFSPGPFQPEPVVTVGSDVTATLPSDGVPTGRIALAGFTVTWGRDRVLDQPDPATATVQLYYPYRSAASAKALTGQQVTLSYRGTLPGASAETRVRFFRGRVTTIRTQPHEMRLARGRQRGAIVTLNLVSVVSDLANITPDAVWPEETLEDRRARIEAAAGGRVTVDVRDYWKTPNVVPFAAESQRSLYDHLTALYDSCGVDRMNFLPDEGMNGALRPALRRDFSGLRGLAGLHKPGTDEGRAGKGCYIRPISAYPADGGPGDAAVPVYLDAAALEYDPADGLELGLDNRITRITYSNPDNTHVTPGTTPEATVAAQQIRDRWLSGGSITATWSWSGMPAEAALHHDDLADSCAADGRDPTDHDSSVIWLAAYIATHGAVGSYATRTLTRGVAGVDEVTQGVRTASATTDVCWNSWANIGASLLRNVCGGEAAAWTLQPLLWELHRTGGFESAEQAQMLLAGNETKDLVFLERSWLPVFGIRPVFGVMGGTIGHDGDDWRVELNIAPVRPPTVAQHAISWEEIDDGTSGHTVRWYDGEHADGLHESVTLEDLGHCATGVGVTTVPADSGWDQ